MVVGEVSSSVDLLVIGGGPGGYAAALNASRLGRKVSLVENRFMGGTCLNVGCIPSKALIEIADLAHLGSNTKDLGVKISTSVDMSKVNDHVKNLVTDLSNGVSFLLDKAEVDVINGTARFTRPNRVAVESEGGHLEHLEFRDAIVATGSSPMTLQNLPTNGKTVVDSETLLFQDSIPDQLTLVGGGYIGVELATVYAKLGSRVVIVESEEQLLPGFNKQLSKKLENGLRSLGIGICLGYKAVSFTGNELIIESDKESSSIPTDLVGVVAGRKPNSDTVNIVESGASLLSTGHVKVDSQRRATEHVFAIGDLTLGPALAHKATAEAKVAADVACGISNDFEPNCIPMVVFSDPQIVTVGIDPDIDQHSEMNLNSFRFPFSASSRAKTLGDESGFVNLVADEEGTIVGFQAIGKHVAELAGEPALAIETATSIDDLIGTIHAHPTMSETISEAALGVAGEPLHISGK
ncbi:MAG: dihydrolipoyl dehydrogenase [Acidimicrobiales bacterium]|nr:dihydrolipoyl dehydrogenase [Acidimicrobiales bacterium]